MKRGKIRITYELLEQAIHLPEGVSIEYIYMDPNTRTINIYLVGPDNTRGLFQVAEGQCIPEISLEGMVVLTPSTLYRQIIE